MLFQEIAFTGYNSNTWILFLIMGVDIQVGVWFLINYSQGYLSASLISSTLLDQHVLAGVITYFLLEEKLSTYHIIGGIIVLIKIYTVHFAKQKRKKLPIESSHHKEH